MLDAEGMDACLDEVPIAWQLAVIDSLCAAEPSGSVSPELLTRLVRTLTAAVHERKQSPEQVTQLLVCLAWQVQVGNPDLAASLGRLLRLYLKHAPREHLGEGDILAAFFKALLSAWSLEDIHSWRAFWGACHSPTVSTVAGWKAFLAVGAELYSADLVEFVRVAVSWFEPGSGETSRYFAQASLAIAPLLTRDDLSRQVMLDESDATRLLYVVAVPSKLRYPATFTPPLAEVLSTQDVLAAMEPVEDEGALRGAWRTNLAANLFRLMGLRAGEQIVRELFDDGIRVRDAADLPLAMGALRALGSMTPRAVRYAQHSKPEVKEAGEAMLRELEAVQRALRQAIANSSDADVRALDKYVGTYASADRAMREAQERLRGLIGSERAARLLPLVDKK